MRVVKISKQLIYEKDFYNVNFKACNKCPFSELSCNKCIFRHSCTSITKVQSLVFEAL